VRWPDGHVTTQSDVLANGSYTIACCGPWEDVGFELAGAAGEPELLGEGALLGNDSMALQLPLPTSAAGALTIGGLWPTGLPGGVEIFFQYWIVDATGPFGFTASNALKATTP
jgi:hypothetical protein